MKILLVSTGDIEGGAAKAAFRLHRSFFKNNLHSIFLTRTKNTTDNNTHPTITKNSLKFLKELTHYINKIPLKRYSKRENVMFSTSLIGENLVKHINKINPDIIHFHWCNRGFLKFSDIKKINQPMVFSLHDMWNFTGGCHYDNECNKYKTTCGKCPILKSNKTNDLSRKQLLQKRKIIVKKEDITVVGASKWISNCAEQSTIFKNSRINTIPNPIDTNVFKPISKLEARKILNLHPNKKYILFTAMESTVNKRKGYKYLIQALEKIETDNVELLILGGTSNQYNNRFTIHNLGIIKDDISLAIIYSAADITIVPSLQENLSLVIIESMSCGTPVIAFNIGGNPDMIQHKYNGYLVKKEDADDLALGINYLLDNTENLNFLSKNARTKVATEYSEKIVTQQFKQLYEKILIKE